MTHHLGYEKHDPAGHHSGNSRNGTSVKTVKSKRGQVQLEVPRDRNSEFEPQLIPKGQRRIDGFDERVLSLYARGMTVREIQAHLEEIYGAQVSPDLISTVTDAVLDEVRAWQSRPLRCGLSHRLSGCAAGQDQRRRSCRQPRHLSRDRRQPAGP
jgi:putative transposase